jgi:hypothetical protein
MLFVLLLVGPIRCSGARFWKEDIIVYAFWVYFSIWSNLRLLWIWMLILSCFMWSWVLSTENVNSFLLFLFVLELHLFLIFGSVILPCKYAFDGHTDDTVLRRLLDHRDIAWTTSAESWASWNHDDSWWTFDHFGHRRSPTWGPRSRITGDGRGKPQRHIDTCWMRIRRDIVHWRGSRSKSSSMDLLNASRGSGSKSSIQSRGSGSKSSDVGWS